MAALNETFDRIIKLFIAWFWSDQDQEVKKFPKA
jgi:hypothetical protein